MFYKCHIFVFLSARKDDEMDPMDPSAYSDAPRYSFKLAPGPVFTKQKSTINLIKKMLSLQGLMVKWPSQT